MIRGSLGRQGPGYAAAPSNADLLDVCPICGMTDPDHLRTGIGAGDWHGWPAHASCIEWPGDWTALIPARALQPASAPDLLGRQWTLDDVRDATPAQVVSAVQAGLLQDVGFGIRPPAAGAVPSVKGGDARF